MNQTAHTHDLPCSSARRDLGKQAHARLRFSERKQALTVAVLLGALLVSGIL